MIKFEPKIGQTSIKARDLDRNFARLQPLQNGQYGINQSEDGWSLNIFPAYPEEAEETQAFFLSYVGGALEWNSGITAGTTAGAILVAQSTETGGPLHAVWSSPPSISGTAVTGGWRLVERCDGKQMYVWGTEWVDPA